MKVQKLFFASVLTLGLQLNVRAESSPAIGTYSMETIMTTVKDGKDIDKKLRDFVDAKQKEVLAEQEKIKKMKADFDNQRKLLNEDKKAKKQKELDDALVAYQEKGMRYENEIRQMREELLKPMREKIFQLASEMGKESNTIFIYDKGEPLLKYAIPYVANEIDLNNKIIDSYNKKYSKK